MEIKEAISILEKLRFDDDAVAIAIEKAIRLKAVLEKNFGHTGGAATMLQLIDIQPTIEPEPKKGGK